MNKELEKEAEEYAKGFDYAEDSSPQIDFIAGATSNAAKEYWYKQFEKQKLEFAIEQLKRFRECTFGKGLDVIKELEQKLSEL